MVLEYETFLSREFQHLSGCTTSGCDLRDCVRPSKLAGVMIA